MKYMKIFLEMRGLCMKNDENKSDCLMNWKMLFQME